jgi:hypothetical protein
MIPSNHSRTWTVWCADSEDPEPLARGVSRAEAFELVKTTDRENVYAAPDPATDEDGLAVSREVAVLTFGYNRGLPPGTATAWGCRAIIDQGGLVDVPPDRQSAAGPRVDTLLDHLNQHVRGAWRERAAELLRNGVMSTRTAAEFVLYQDSKVMIKGDTNASAGYLYVCAYLLTEEDEG